MLLTRKENMAAGTLTELEENDLLSLMIKARDDETNNTFTDQLIKDNSFTFFAAGHETISTSLSGILLFLAKVWNVVINMLKESFLYSIDIQYASIQIYSMFLHSWVQQKPLLVMMMMILCHILCATEMCDTDR